VWFLAWPGYAIWRQWTDGRRTIVAIGSLLLALLSLLPLLEFLQDLLGSPDAVLIGAARSGSSATLPSSLSFISVILTCLVVGLGIVRIIGVIGVIFFSCSGDYRTSQWRRSHWRRSVFSIHLASRGSADPSSQNYSSEGVGIGCRAEQDIVEVRSVEQFPQDVTGRPGAEMTDDALIGIAGNIHFGAGLSPDCLENVRQNTIVGCDGQLAVAKNNLWRNRGFLFQSEGRRDRGLRIHKRFGRSVPIGVGRNQQKRTAANRN